MAHPRTVLSAGVLAAFLALPGAASAEPGERSARLIGLLVTLAAQRGRQARPACPAGRCRKAVRTARRAPVPRKIRDHLALGTAAAESAPLTRRGGATAHGLRRP